MRIFKITLLVLFSLIVVGPATANISQHIYKLSDSQTDDHKRDSLVRQLSAMPLSAIGETIVKELHTNRPEIGYAGIAKTKKPWAEAQIPVSYKIYYAYGEIWSQINRNAKSKSSTELLVGWMMKPDSKQYRYIYLQALIEYHWDESLEKNLVNFAKDPKEEYSLRVTSTKVLLSKIDLNKHFTLFIDVLNSLSSLRRNHFFTNCMNIGHQLKKLNPENRRLFLDYGFSILAYMNDNKSGSGYPMARRIGFLLEAPNEFAPNQEDSKYQDKFGLSAQYFQDTVNNALEWFSKHPTRTTYK